MIVEQGDEAAKPISLPVAIFIALYAVSPLIVGKFHLHCRQL